MMGTYRLLDLVPKGRDERDAAEQDGVGAPPRPLRAGGRRRRRLRRSSRSPEAAAALSGGEHGMASLWPWLAVAGMGALHGLNPATGWLFAAASGVRSGDRTLALRALLPIGLGHAASVALVAGAVALGVALDRGLLQIAAGGLLLVAVSLHLGAARTPAAACAGRRRGWRSVRSCRPLRTARA